MGKYNQNAVVVLFSAVAPLIAMLALQAARAQNANVPPSAPPHVSTNLELGKETCAFASGCKAGVVYAQGVWRDDYAAGNGAPPLFFAPEVGTCASNSKVNDGGSCVNDASGNSWVARFPAGSILDIREFGASVASSDNTVALNAALAVSSAVSIPAGTFEFTTKSAIRAVAKRITCAGSNATRLQFAATTGYALRFGGSDSSAPALVGCTIIGNANAAGGILFTNAGTGTRRAYFKDDRITGFTKPGTFGCDIQGSANNGAYYNTFINVGCDNNAGGWRLRTIDYDKTRLNRVNSNVFVNTTGSGNTGDGYYISEGSENTFISADREGNGGWGFNLQGDDLATTIVGGDSENNASGSINKASSAPDIHVLGGNVSEAPGGGENWNRFDQWFPGGRQSGAFGVDASGNATIGGNVALMRPNPTFLAAGGIKVFGVNTDANDLLRHFRGETFDSARVRQSAGRIDLSGVVNKVIDTTLAADVTSITMPAAVDGLEISWYIQQAATEGPYTVRGFPSNVLFPGGIYKMSTGAGKRDIITFRYSGGENKWFVTSLVQNE